MSSNIEGAAKWFKPDSARTQARQERLQTRPNRNFNIGVSTSVNDLHSRVILNVGAVSGEYTPTAVENYGISSTLNFNANAPSCSSNSEANHPVSLPPSNQNGDTSSGM